MHFVYTIYTFMYSNKYTYIYIYAYSVLDIPLFVLGINTVIDESCFVPKKEHQHFYADGHILWSKNLTLPARVSELKSLYN